MSAPKEKHINLSRSYPFHQSEEIQLLLKKNYWLLCRFKVLATPKGFVRKRGVL